MEKNPLVSIIVPVFNEEKNIKKNIESLINQDYDNIEIIIVNDKSTDESIKIANRYIEKNPNIKILNNEKNKGASYSRNKGLDIAKGKYIIFIDGDDYAEKELISTLVKTAEEEKLDLVQVNYIKEEIDKSVLQKHFKVKKDVYKGKEDILENISALISNNRNSDQFFSLIRSVAGKIFKRNIIEKKEKLRFKEDLVLSENLIFTMEYMLRAKKIKYLEKYLIHFKKDEASLRESYIPKIEKEAKNSIKYMRKLIRETKTELELSKNEKKKIDEDFAYFVFERVFLVYKHKINRVEEGLDEKSKKRNLLEFINKNNLYKYIKKIDRKKLDEEYQKFLKYIKNSVFLRKFRII